MLLAVVRAVISGLLLSVSLDVAFAGDNRTSQDVSGKTLVAFVHQTKSVRSACFTPELKVVLARLRKTFGRELVVTSGFRGRKITRSGSYHGRCMAADVQIPGVSPGKLRQVARATPGIGGIGTYCHTRSVHIDVGPRREWSWGCRKKRR
jgi:uncharacterized protein YcbK (DUF882 family)